ncbi:hypothetical protein C1I63_13835 [Rathayibacter caricis DSM 15933]|uniref:Uncharacterized protein n=2 Tax=Rathayibacter caricis TaxID=110936 RepID=A0A2T4UWD7_9MICO|nr:hypothetical protein C1I63_13835 [Rathayibacter caricis DSM 15933]
MTLVGELEAMSDGTAATLIEKAGTRTQAAVRAQFVEALAEHPDVTASAGLAAAEAAVGAVENELNASPRLPRLGKSGRYLARVMNAAKTKLILAVGQDAVLYVFGALNVLGELTRRRTSKSWLRTWSIGNRVVFGIRKDLRIFGIPDDAMLAYIASHLGPISTPIPQAPAPSLEGLAWYDFGHSWATGTGGQSNGTVIAANAMIGTVSGGYSARWFDRVQRRMGLAVVAQKGVAGRTIGDISNLLIQPASSAATTTNKWAWQTYSKGVASVVCTVNDLTLFQGSAASKRGYLYAWRATLAALTARSLGASTLAQWVYSAGWTKELAAGTATSTAGATPGSTSGSRWTTTTANAFAEFSYVDIGGTALGNGVDVFLVARAAGAGVATIAVDGTTVGTLDLTQPTAQDCIAVFSIRGRSAGTHTVRVTHTSGASLTVDSYRIPHPEPITVLVLGEPPVAPATTDYPGYLADLASWKGELAAICATFPTVQFLDLAPGWDTATMLSDDGGDGITGRKHPSDKGSAFIASAIESKLKDLAFTRGTNIHPGSVTTVYTAPTAPTTPTGGHVGTATSGT